MAALVVFHPPRAKGKARAVEEPEEEWRNSRAVRRRQGHLRVPPRCLRTNDAGCNALAPSRTVAFTLVSCRQAGACPDSSDASKGKKTRKGTKSSTANDEIAIGSERSETE